MAAEVLQEYLTKLGFVVDAVSHKKLTDALTTTEKQIFKVGGAVAGMVTAVDAAVSAFAYSMRKMYFMSELSGTSVKGLESMAFAGKQFGISADTMEASIAGMAQAMRLNPGLKSLVESFGIKVEGRDVSNVMMDFVQATKQMPEYVGAQYAGMFGIDPSTYHMMREHLAQLRKAQREARSIYKDLGFDPDSEKNKKAIEKFTKDMDEIEIRMKVLGQAFLVAILPAFEQFTQFVRDNTRDLIKWLGGKMTTGDMLKDAEKNVFYSLGMDVLYNKIQEGNGWLDEKLGLTADTAGKPTQGFLGSTVLGLISSTSAASELPARSVNQTNQTTIHVHGNGAQDTANAVVMEQKRIHGNNLRDLVTRLNGGG